MTTIVSTANANRAMIFKKAPFVITYLPLLGIVGRDQKKYRYLDCDTNNNK